MLTFEAKQLKVSMMYQFVAPTDPAKFQAYNN